jgi:hypothetical protein
MIACIILLTGGLLVGIQPEEPIISTSYGEISARIFEAVCPLFVCTPSHFAVHLQLTRRKHQGTARLNFRFRMSIRLVREFVKHYHRERNHQGLRNALIAGTSAIGTVGRVHRRPRLGGRLNYYERAA